MCVWKKKIEFDICLDASAVLEAVKQNIWMKAAPQKHLHTGCKSWADMFFHHLNTLIDSCQHIATLLLYIDNKTENTHTHPAGLHTYAQTHTGTDTPTHL